ncbi:unnamed protein product [Gongylonema pulchrum]|uniref:Uncharacterized protein n=1 Tax=Gongylonema pulchrum TaxID=637853 RepID=A0A3P7P142_9BILA|nr:unnamed protein product [Gongylonema pulchrum]
MSSKNEPKSQSKSTRPLISGASAPSTSKDSRVVPDEKASRILKDIDNALAQVMLEVERALTQTDTEYAKEKLRCVKFFTVVKANGSSSITKAACFFIDSDEKYGMDLMNRPFSYVVVMNSAHINVEKWLLANNMSGGDSMLNHWAALKSQMILLFSSLEQHGEPTHLVNRTVIQYLYHSVRPLFKDAVKFK